MLEESLPELFLDTDVAFDIISKREPHYVSSIKRLQLAAKGTVQLVISESSLANLFYLSFDIYKITDGNTRLSDFIQSCKVINGGKRIALEALQSPFKDKEDALQYLTALHAKINYFITRNIKDYKHKQSSLPVYTPDGFLKLMDKPAE